MKIEFTNELINNLVEEAASVKAKHDLNNGDIDTIQYHYVDKIGNKMSLYYIVKTENTKIPFLFSIDFLAKRDKKDLTNEIILFEMELEKGNFKKFNAFDIEGSLKNNTFGKYTFDWNNDEMIINTKRS